MIFYLTVIVFHVKMKKMILGVSMIMIGFLFGVIITMKNNTQKISNYEKIEIQPMSIQVSGGSVLGTSKGGSCGG